MDLGVVRVGANLVLKSASTGAAMFVRAFAILGLTSLASLGVAMASTGCIHGRTLDAAGGAVGQAAISVLGGDGGRVHSASSGADGRFQVCGLTAGSYRVSASAAGYETGVQNTSLADGQDVQVEIRLQATGVSGKLKVRKEFSSVTGVLKNGVMLDDPSVCRTRALDR